MKKLFYSLIFLSAFLLSACSKKKVVPIPDKPDATGTALDRVKDSIYLYAKEEYLWYSQIPDYATVAPRSVTDPDDLTALQKLSDKLSQYAVNPATSQPYEFYPDDPGEAKYSFVDAGQTAGELNGVKGDFGFNVGFQTVNGLYIAFVYPGSPADVQGLKRGYKVTSINNSTNIAFDGSSVGGNSANLSFISNAVFYSNTISLTAMKPDGSTLTVSNMAIANYTVKPVLTYKTFDQGNGRIVGYFVFNSFTSDDNADAQLNQAFDYFTQQHVTDLVVDLRYNGGGYVTTAEYLDNLIVPAAKSGTVMYNTYYNDKLQADKDPLLAGLYGPIPPGTFKPENNVVNFNKVGSLNVSHVYFIITGATASASELTINNLRPEMDVKFIGNTSYGKPVGFFALDINKYQYYTPEFYTLNSANQGGYYAGFTPNTADYPGVEDGDDYTKDFGDPTEKLLAHALNFVKTGSFAVAGPAIQSIQTQQRVLSISDQRVAMKKLTQHQFVGMVSNKKLKLKK